jgi:hypothetical protein
MKRLRIRAALAIGLVLGYGVPAASESESGLPFNELGQLLSSDIRARRAAAAALVAKRDPALIAPLVDAYFFTPKGNRAELQRVLEDLTGESFASYKEWVEYVGSRHDLVQAEGYVLWKVALLSKIDPRYHQILYRSVRSELRLEELMWGGVPVDGIPSLDAPPTLPVARAELLRDEERVFGVAIGGRARAYPLRFLDWHEMVNDTLAGQPYALSYCTLCGSGILYATDKPGGRYEMGTSGLLYRSNKLMFDRESFTLWSNLTGEPVVGRLVDVAPPLTMLPMTLTTWGEWRRRHPESDVLDLEKLRDGPGRRYHFDYSPGAANRARSGVSFPVWQKDERIDRDAEIYALRINGEPKAYLLDALLAHRLLPDRVGGVDIVLVVESGSGAVRVFERGERRFGVVEGTSELTDERGIAWRVGEDAMVTESGERLPRVPGHVAYWFGWYGFYPQTEVYTGEESP